MNSVMGWGSDAYEHVHGVEVKSDFGAGSLHASCWFR